MANLRQLTKIMGSTALLLSLFLTACSDEKALYQPAVAKLIQKADVLKKAGNRDEAICRLEAAADIAPDTFQVQYNLGIVYTDAANWQKAVEHLEQAVKITPDQPNGLYSLAFAYQSMGDQYAMAANPADTAAPSRPETPSAIKGISPQDAAAQKSAAYQKAIETYQKFLKVAPSSDPGRTDAEEQIKRLQQESSDSGSASAATEPR